ncbi:hypothetical protein H4R34_003794 [Dimargaris verticillata]|uniref:TATA element modulatory factor 1 TATA binding domain-containing protein n=1 Tax=Dimargaris verticillata TaxID=2761393 RepID=A0A9W8B5F7_9FUNG|nr:hypothetical protein H4R34_003794 [Dimargaris verticillata]
MSFFGSPSANNGWSGMLRQAINTMENKLDQVLDVQPDGTPSPGRRPTPRRTNSASRPPGRASSSEAQRDGPTTRPTKGASTSGRPLATVKQSTANVSPNSKTSSPTDPATVPKDGQTTAASSNGLLPTAHSPVHNDLSRERKNSPSLAERKSQPMGPRRPSTTLSPSQQALSDPLRDTASSPNSSPDPARPRSRAVTVTRPPSRPSGEVTASSILLPHESRSRASSLTQPTVIPTIDLPLAAMNPDPMQSPLAIQPPDKASPGSELDSRSLVDQPSANTLLAKEPNSNQVDAILEQRERQLVALNQRNSDLMDQMDQLQSKLDYQTAINSTFTQAHQEKLQLKDQEINRLQTELQGLHPDSADGAALHQLVSQLKAQVADRDQRLDQLISEGRDLSKQELRLSNTIKKLKLDVTHREKRMKELQSQTDQANAKVDKWIKIHQSAQDLAQRQDDKHRAQAAQIDQLNRTILGLRKELRGAQDGQKSLQVALDHADQEAAEAKRECDRLKQSVKAQTSETEASATRRMEAELARARKDWEASVQALEQQAGEAKQQLIDAQTAFAAKEADWQTQLSTLRMRLDVSTSTQDSYSLDLHEHTAPLFHQIEELTSRLNHETHQRAQSERKLMHDLKRAQKRAQETQHRLNEATAQLNATTPQVINATEALAATRATLETQRAENDQLRRTLAAINTQVVDLQQQVAGLEAERDALVDEKAKVTHAMAMPAMTSSFIPSTADPRPTIRTNGLQLHSLSPIAYPLTDQSALKSNSPPLPSQVPGDGLQGQDLDRQFPAPSSSPSSFESPALSGRSLVAPGDLVHHHSSPGSHRGSVSVSDMAPEHPTLLTALKQLTAQLATVQTQLAAVTAQRNSLEEDLVTRAQEHQALADRLARLDAVEAELTDLKQRHSTTLELLGEKTEHVLELQADIADIKEMYKTQITELISKVEQLSSR